ncbi:MAG TPA: DUF4157 domain-containing protein [Chitinophaga sp.]
MKTNSRRYRRHRNPETPEKKETPFFTRSQQKVQAKGDAFFQPKLAVGQPGDKFEREADTVADKVVNKQSSNDTALQRKEISSVQAKGMPEAEKEKEKPLQKKDDPLKQEDEQASAAAPDAKKEEEKPVQLKDDPLKKEEEKPVQKKDDPLKKEEEKPVQKKDDPLKKEEEKPIQKKEEMEKREEKGEEVPVMTKRESNGQQQADSHATLEQRLQKRGGGYALSPQVAAEMGHAIGADFNGVRIHTGEEAAQMNRDLGAQAFTHGNDIYFNSGKYDPATSSGKHLLAHELTHVVQQGAAPAATEKAPAAAAHAAPGVQRDTSTPLPKEAVVDKKSKVATLQSGDFTVKVKPDRKAKKGEDVKPDGAVTNGNINASVTYKTENGKVTSVTIKKELTIQTTYGLQADPSADSAYGRGHIKKDKEAGNSSLRFHEGSHGQDFIEYVKTHPYPTIVIEEPISIQEYNTLMSEWKAQAEQYQRDMEAHSKTHTDDVTDPPVETTPAPAK